MRLNKIRLVIERVLSFFASIHSINFEHCQFICVGEYLSISGWNLIDHCEQINLWALFAAIDQNRFYSVQPIDFDDDNFHDEQWTNVTLLRLSHFVITFIVSIFFLSFSHNLSFLCRFFFICRCFSSKRQSRKAPKLSQRRWNMLSWMLFRAENYRNINLSWKHFGLFLERRIGIGWLDSSKSENKN